MRKNINGILLLNKSIGTTSNRELQTAKRIYQAMKAGHTGSLDPIATGMLPLCFGAATKFCQYLLDADKSYSVTAQLGVTTTTGDSEGSVTATQSIAHVTKEKIAAVIANFVGEQEQVPPMFSALKHKGKPLYELARQGIEIERQPRRITIFSLILNEFVDDRLTLHVHCSKGTYVRTLIEDIGRELQCGAHVVGLHRDMVAPYHNAKMYTLAELETIAATQGDAGLQAVLLPMQSSVNIFPVIHLSTASAFYLRMGQAVRTSLVSDSKFVQLLAEDGKFLGIGEVLIDGRVKPHRLVA